MSIIARHLTTLRNRVSSDLTDYVFNFWVTRSTNYVSKKIIKFEC